MIPVLRTSTRPNQTIDPLRCQIRNTIAQGQLVGRTVTLKPASKSMSARSITTDDTKEGSASVLTKDSIHQKPEKQTTCNNPFLPQKDNTPPLLFELCVLSGLVISLSIVNSEIKERNRRKY